MITGVTRPVVARVFWLTLSVVVAASVLTELGRAISGANVLTPEGAAASTPTRVLRFFSYFTIQSNLLVLAATLPLVRDPGHDGRAWRALRLTSLLGIAVTGLIYALVLGPTLDPQGLAWWTNAGLHYAAPLLAVLGWLGLGPRPRVDAAAVRGALVWPLAWIGYILVLGAITAWYPYPFLDAGDLGYPVALRNLAGVVVLSVVVLVAFRLLDGRLVGLRRR